MKLPVTKEEAQDKRVIEFLEWEIRRYNNILNKDPSLLIVGIIKDKVEVLLERKVSIARKYNNL